jgi:hypothetical protein
MNMKKQTPGTARGDSRPTLKTVKPLDPELPDDAATITVPVCVTLEDFIRYMTIFHCGKRTTQGWADLQMWFWKHPQNPTLN